MSARAAVAALVVLFDAEIKRRAGLKKLREDNFPGFVEGMKARVEQGRILDAEMHTAAQAALAAVQAEGLTDSATHDGSSIGFLLEVTVDSFTPAGRPMWGDDLRCFAKLFRTWAQR